MPHTPVTSSFIASIHHDGGEHLEIKLKTGKTLRLKTGAADGATHHAAMLAAESPGKYFAMHLRGKFDVETLAADEEQPF